METTKRPEPIPPMRRGANSYKPEDILRWGVQRFMDEIASKELFEIPALKFSNEENQRMDEILRQGRKRRQQMVFDSNVIIKHIRRLQRLPAQAVIPMVVAGELEAFALKSDWVIKK